MNDTMSLLLATTILAVGGLGLFMYKNSDDKESSGDDYNEDSLFNMGSFWGSNDNDDDGTHKENDKEEEDVEIYEPKSRSRASKTKRNRKTIGSKRRY
jgi:hypothetical protein